MQNSPLLALSPLDGRYQAKVSDLSAYFSEYALIKYRLKVEIEWLIALSGEAHFCEVPNFSTKSIDQLRGLVDNFSLNDAKQIKKIEEKTNHDVKALEYWIKKKLVANQEAVAVFEFIHFACTSEDINNLAHGLMLQNAQQSLLQPKLNKLIKQLRDMAHQLADIPMMSRTHGQPATPTTIGKELANFVYRLEKANARCNNLRLSGKINGAVGNFNAHLQAYPNFDWQTFAQKFVESLGLEFNPYTIQIEPHDTLAAVFAVSAQINTILLDLCRDIWGYISLGYFKQKTKAGEVGSSTMPHKVNPIDFENAEGNFGLANAIFNHLTEKLPISRWQRDLTDSTVLRNMGVAYGYSYLAFDSCTRGLVKLEVNADKMAKDLDQAWELLAEAVQTVMRRYGLPKPYEQLKKITRGQGISAVAINAFIKKLNIPEDAKQQLLQLTPSSYIGLAASLAKNI